MEKSMQIHECDHVSYPSVRHMPKVGTGVVEMVEALRVETEEKADSFKIFGGKKKGSFTMLSDTTKQIVVFAIMLVLGVAIVAGVRDTFYDATVNATQSTTYLMANTTLGLFTTLNTWAPIVLLVLVAYIILRYLGLFDKSNV